MAGADNPIRRAVNDPCFAVAFVVGCPGGRQPIGSRLLHARASETPTARRFATPERLLTSVKTVQATLSRIYSKSQEWSY